MARYTFTRVNPFIVAGAGEQWYFRIGDDPTEFYCEDWATDNSSGKDFYRADDNKPVNPSLFESAEDEDEFEAQLTDFTEDYFSLWRQFVEPQIGRAQRDAIKRMERRHKAEDNHASPE